MKSRAKAIFKLLNNSSLPFHCGWKTRFWWFFQSSPPSFRSGSFCFHFFHSANLLHGVNGKWYDDRNRVARVQRLMAGRCLSNQSSLCLHEARLLFLSFVIGRQTRKLSLRSAAFRSHYNQIPSACLGAKRGGGFITFRQLSLIRLALGANFQQSSLSLSGFVRETERLCWNVT